MIYGAWSKVHSVSAFRARPTPLLLVKWYITEGKDGEREGGHVGERDREGAYEYNQKCRPDKN